MPVLQRERWSVFDAAALLLATVDEKQPPEAFLGEATEIRLLVAVEDQHVAAEVEQFERGCDPRNAAADDDDLRRVIRHEQRAF